MARSTLTLEEAEELAHFVIPAAPDVRLPARWRLSVDGVPVAPVPEVGTHLFARAVGLYRARLSPEELADPQYAPNNPGWADRLADDHLRRLHAYAGPRPPTKHNRARRHQLWDGRTFEEVVAPYRVQARSTRGTGGARMNVGPRPAPRWPLDGDRGADRLGSGDRRKRARDGAGSSSCAPPPEPAPEPEPPLLAEYRRLAAEAGDPEDMPGYLTAIRESENAPMPPPLVQEYMQLAPVAVHPEDPPDFPGYHAAVADSMAAPVVDLDDSSSDNGDDSDGLYDEMDFGGVEDE